MKKMFYRVIVALALLGLGIEHAQADRFQDDIKPYLQKFCTECHGKKDPKGGLDLTAFDSDQSLVRSFRKWDDITNFIRSGEMPPKGSPQPEIEQSNRVLAAVESVLLKEARKHAVDPGFVPPRRLSNTDTITPSVISPAWIFSQHVRSLPTQRVAKGLIIPVKL